MRRLSAPQKGRCDQLSRRGPATNITVTEHAYNLGLGQTLDLKLDSDTDVTALVALCNPSISFSTDSEFSSFWKTARARVDSFITRYRSRSSHASPPFPTNPLSTFPSQKRTELRIPDPSDNMGKSRKADFFENLNHFLVGCSTFILEYP